MAHAVLAGRAARAGVGERLHVESAGTDARAAMRVDPRAVSVCARRGYDVLPRKPRNVTARDFARFDAIFAMDAGNLRALQGLRPATFEGRLALLLSLVPASAVRELPDPYFGSLASFEQTLDLIEAAADALVRELPLPPA